MATEMKENPIYVYGDAEALEDGMIVDISGLNLSYAGMSVNRITDSLWREGSEKCAGYNAYHYAKDDDRCYVVCDWIKAVVGNFVDATASSEAEKIMEVPEGDSLWGDSLKMWLVKNEVDGWTLMLPSDY